MQGPIAAIDKHDSRSVGLEEQMPGNLAENRLPQIKPPGHPRPQRADALLDVGRERPLARSPVADAAENPQRIGNRLKEVGQLADRLRGTEKRIAALTQREVKKR